ncbi:MAG: hypothetical protein ISS14_02160 [Actinobacteria bacterium]|nr:hypothetical protein [Actinomycetota bacterium]MBL7123677.1 hypothetical protein [Actinomycetota bacterium]
MKKINIIILIICTIILIIVSITVMQKRPDIENIYLSSDRDSSFDKLKQNNNYYFDSRNLDIYLIIEVKHLTTEDEIKVQWEKTENSSCKIIQKNIVNPEQKGSGKIIISLVKKNDMYPPGNYNVRIYLNGSSKISKKFYISDKI